MINFIEGYIELGAQKIFADSDCNHLNSLAEEGLIERQKNGRGETYYHVESLVDSMKFSVYVKLRGKRIQWLVMHWLDGPCTSKGWDGVSEKALKEEYRLLLDFVEKMTGCPSNNKKDRQRTWRFQWGQVDVSYEPRDFVAAIFMVPR